MSTAKPQTHYDPTMSVQAAIACIIGELPAIGKNEEMGSGNYGYKYRGIETITAHVQPLLAKYGVVIAPRSTLVSIQPAVGAKDGWQDTVLSVEWLIVGPDATTITANTIGIGRDNSDKGANKAASQAFKYLLLHLFCISDASDDADGHPNESIRETTPVEELFEAVKATASTPLADDLKALAESEGKKLSAKALADDPEWAGKVRAFLTEGKAE